MNVYRSVPSPPSYSAVNKMMDRVQQMGIALKAGSRLVCVHDTLGYVEIENTKIYIALSE